MAGVIKEKRQFFFKIFIYFMSVEQTHSVIHDYDVIKAMNLVRNIVEDVLNRKRYNEQMADQWTQQIIHSCQQSLTDIQQSFRTIVSAVIVPKNIDNVHMGNGCLWDFGIDGSTIVE